MIELRATLTQGKPTIIPLVDPDASRGGLTEDQVGEQLIRVETNSYAKWGFDYDDTLSAKALHKALWANEPIENGTASARFKMCEYGKHPILSRP